MREEKNGGGVMKREDKVFQIRRRKGEARFFDIATWEGAGM